MCIRDSRNTDRHDYSSDAGQGKAPEIAEDAYQPIDVQAEYYETGACNQPQRAVEGDHEQRHYDQPHYAGYEPPVQGVSTECSSDVLLGKQLELNGQGAGLQHDGEVLRLLVGEVAGDLTSATRYSFLDIGSRLHLVVEHDGELLACILLGYGGELLGAGAIQREIDLCIVRGVVADLGLLYGIALEKGRAELKGHCVLALRERQCHRIIRLEVGLTGSYLPVGILLCVLLVLRLLDDTELQLGGLSD